MKKLLIVLFCGLSLSGCAMKERVAANKSEDVRDACIKDGRKIYKDARSEGMSPIDAGNAQNNFVHQCIENSRRA